MLNFREELEKIRKGQFEKPSTEEYAEIFLKELLNTLADKKKNGGELIFYLGADEIKLKTNENNFTSLFIFQNKNALEIFNFVKAKLESEGYVFRINSIKTFSISLN